MNKEIHMKGIRQRKLFNNNTHLQLFLCQNIMAKHFSEDVMRTISYGYTVLYTRITLISDLIM